jgi:CspA family cold shock protein
VLGTVREWDDELGWGVITADEMPEPIWVHFSGVDEDPNEFRALRVGDRVTFEIEGPVDQDGFRVRARGVRPA